MKNIFKAMTKKKERAIKSKCAYFVLGSTGCGKSTFINSINGTRYEQEMGKLVPKECQEIALQSNSIQSQTQEVNHY